MSWLDELLKQTGEGESPERYNWWSGLAAISAVVRKNVYLNKYKYVLYPNIYVALISAKSAGRKGAPIKLCKDLLQEVNATRIISGCHSIQGMIKELGDQKTLDNGLVVSDAHGILLSEEFASFLTDDPKALTYLTALYGTHEHEKGWEYILKNQSPIRLKAPCLTMLVASNEMLFSKMVKLPDFEGGFIGRTVLVKESKISKINSLVYPPENELNIKALSSRLSDIAKIKGGFKYSKESGELYDNWYRGMMSAEHDDRTGTYDRLGDQVLKVAMLVSLAKKDDLEFDCEDMQIAIDKCEECAEETARTTSVIESTNGDRIDAMKLVRDIIVASEHAGKKYRITKSALLNKLSKYGIYSDKINPCIFQLKTSGWIIECEISANGSSNPNSKILYALTEEGAKVYVREKSGHA